MATYTVYQPPLRGDETAPNPERFVFVRDGFRFWAFVFAPIWLLVKRLWLVFLAYIIVMLAFQVGVKLLTGSNDITTAATLLVSLLFGLEAPSLQRWTLRGRKWTEVGVVTGRNEEEAERRFFDGWVAHQAPRPAASSTPISSLPPVFSSPVPPAFRPSQGPGVIGLFPEPGATR